jgi:hypothetical protein
MHIGKPLRTVIVEPLELPAKQPTTEPNPVPIPAPEPVQVQSPLDHSRLHLAYRWLSGLALETRWATIAKRPSMAAGSAPRSELRASRWSNHQSCGSRA